MRNQKPETRAQSKQQGKIFVISGPSGSGKTTLRDKLLEEKIFCNRLVKSISFTTRPKRPGEKEGKDYFFITREEFQKKAKAKKIIERTSYLGYDYGTPKDFVKKQLDEAGCVLLCLDLAGALQIKKLYPKNTVTIFILPPSLAALRNRIKARCNSTKKEEIRRRVGLARQELLASGKYDYWVVNDQLQRAVGELKEIILKETGISFTPLHPGLKRLSDNVVA